MKLIQNIINKISKQRVVVFVFLSFFIVAGMSYLLYQYVNNQDKVGRGELVFVIDGKEFYERDVDSLITYPLEVSGDTKEYSTQYVFEKLKFITIAEKMGVKIEDRVLQPYYDLIVPEPSLNIEKYKPWFDVLVKYEAIRDSLGKKSTAGFEGFAHVFYFGQNIEYSADDPPSNPRDPATIAADRAYAEEKANYYHEQLTSAKMTNEEVDKAIKEDVRLSNLLSVSNPFGADSASLQDQIFYKSVLDYILSAQVTGLSSVMIGQAAPEPVVSFEDPEVELYYYFVDITRTPQSKSITVPELEKAILDAEIFYYAPYDDSSREYPITADNLNEPPRTLKEEEL